VRYHCADAISDTFSALRICFSQKQLLLSAMSDAATAAAALRLRPQQSLQQ
jgi:hypothetical protein